VLRLDRLRALVDVYPGVEREDEMVAAFDYCLFGKGGAAPSIDTAMHGLVESTHVDHLHPDSGIAFATAADGEALTRPASASASHGSRGAGPGSSWASTSPRSSAITPTRSGRSSAATGSRRGARRPRRARRTRSRSSAPRSSGSTSTAGRAVRAVIPGYEPLPAVERRARAAALLPVVRGLASTDHPAGRPLHDSDVVLDFLSRSEHPALAALGTSCPDHFLRTKVRPLVLDLPPTAPLEDAIARLRELHAAYRDEYRAYYERNADARLARDARRRPGDRPRARRRDVQLRRDQADRPRRRRVLRQRDQRHARRRGALDVRPDPESEKFRIEYWALEEAKLRGCRPEAARHAGRVRDRRRVGDRQGDRRAARRRGRLRRRRGHRGRDGGGRAAGLGGPDVALGVACDVTDAGQVAAAFEAAVLAFGGVDIVVNNAGLSISKSLFDTTEADWDLQHDVMAKGSFLVSREAARVMRDQAMGGDLIYIVSKNAFFAGPNNVAYGATKADQAHQVRLLAAELGQFGIRVNGVNPDGVVRGSGIFAKGWGADRAEDLRHPRGQARRVLRAADAAEEGSPAGARRGRGVRARRRRPVTDDGAAHPGRRRRRRGVPALRRSSRTRMRPGRRGRPGRGARVLTGQRVSERRTP
jgi:NAD(P)-dependent dehydrogenase (short-subunit alcohol dehydrogenase family)